MARAHRLGPTLVAISACSPWLHGRDTGWKSARQRAWVGLDPRACGPVPGCVAPSPADDGLDPAAAWARYALAAPVVFVRCAAATRSRAVRASVSFGQWASGAVRLGRRAPTAADLDVHLTTLFPPVRLRGYLELRYLDMTPPRWWPAIAAVATTLMDDPVAADQAAEATEATAALWTEAARDGLGHAVAGRLRPPLPRRSRPAGCRPSSPRPSPTWPTWSSRAAVRATCWPSASPRSGPLAAFEELAHA